MISNQLMPDRLVGFLMVVLMSGAAIAAEPVPDMQAQIKLLDERMGKLESLLQNQSALNLLKEVEAMKAELSRLRGKDETQDHQLSSLTKRQSDLYVDLDKRVDDLGKQVKTVSAQPAPVAVVVAAAPAVAPSPAKPAEQANSGQTRPESTKPAAARTAEQADDLLAESKAYEAALNLFRAGNYAGAISGFQRFLRTYPNSTLAPNAQYWMGFAYYASKDYKNSLEQQRKLVSNWPQSSKVPEAMLNIASNQLELNDLPAAKKNLQEIIARYPGTNAAAIASRRLALLK